MGRLFHRVAAGGATLPIGGMVVIVTTASAAARQPVLLRQLALGRATALAVRAALAATGSQLALAGLVARHEHDKHVPELDPGTLQPLANVRSGLYEAQPFVVTKNG
uniref:Uncharacterized protein n=1 Tax=Anopheles melas TaxID=34690 RepID=A0A182UDW9_9DIPT